MSDAETRTIDLETKSYACLTCVSSTLNQKIDKLEVQVKQATNI
jgi:hypothetical protein